MALGCCLLVQTHNGSKHDACSIQTCGRLSPALTCAPCAAAACTCAQGLDGPELVYGQGGADAAGGLMESSYRNLQEARVVLQAAHALLTAGEARVWGLCCVAFLGVPRGWARGI